MPSSHNQRQQTFQRYVTPTTMVEQSTIARTVVLGIIVFVSLHVLVSSISTATTTKKSSSPSDDDEQTENLKPWYGRWDSSRIAFHLKDVNPILIRYVDQLLSKQQPNKDDTCSNTRVLLPLCGKTVDMAYLVEKGTNNNNKEKVDVEVVGVEGIRQAIEEFIEEQPQLKISKTDYDTETKKQGLFETYRGLNISLLKGDFFKLTEDATSGKFDAIFDRGSLVAIDPKMRSNYIEVIGNVISPGGRILLVTVERQGRDAEAVKKGPPFSISEKQVRELFEPLDWVNSVTLLESKDEFADLSEIPQKFAGLDHLFQLAFLIQAN